MKRVMAPGWWRDRPWTTKLAVLLVLLALLPVTSLAIYNQTVLRREMLGSAVPLTLQRARGTAELIDLHLDAALAQIQVFAARDLTNRFFEVSNPGIRPLVASELRQAQEMYGFTVLGFADQSGDMILATGEELGLNVIATRAFLTAMAGRAEIHQPRWEPESDRALLSVSAPVRATDGRVIGALLGRFSLDRIDRIIAADAGFSGRREYGMLWDELGIRLSDPGHARLTWTPLAPLDPYILGTVAAEQRFGPRTAEWLRTASAFPPLVERSRDLLFDRESDPYAQFVDGDGERWHAAIVPLRHKRWLYAVLVPESGIAAATAGAMRQAQWIALLVGLMGAVLALAITRWATTPLRRHAEELEQRVAERTSALQASEAESRALLAAIPDGLFRVDAEGVIRDFIAPAGGGLPPPRELFVDKRLEDLLPVDVAASMRRTVAEALRSGELQIAECQLEVGGVPTHYEARMAVSRVGGSHGAAPAAEVLAIVRNVSARKQVEDRLAFLSRASAALSASLREDQILAQLTSLPVPLLADRCRVEMAGADGSVPVPPASASADRLVVPIRVQERTLGALILERAAPVRPYTRRDRTLADDLASRAAIAIEHARLYAELQEANSLKDEFLGTVSHELRTPLNAILGWTHILQEETLAPAQARHALETIQRNARGQAQLVEDLLDVSRIITGKLTLDLGPVDLGHLVQASVETLRPAAAARQITLEIVCPPTGVQAWGDAARLQQVAWNLVSNAVKFTPSGGTVSVAVERDDESVMLHVRDTGIGIPSDFLPYVFERFRQADSSMTRSHGGLGLGLAIVRHIVELHGGQVSARSGGVGMGAEFSVRLGRRPPDADAHLPIRGRLATPAVPQAALGSLSGVSVVVVDDDEDARDLMTIVLTAQGADVRAVASAAEALEAVWQARPDVLVSDIGMPHEDGYTLIRRLRALVPSPPPAVAVTAYAGAGHRARALAEGFRLHLAKPIEPQALLSAVAELAHRSASGWAAPTPNPSS